MSNDTQSTFQVSHRDLLYWFQQRAGHVLTWQQLLEAPATVTISAKGIYKPKTLEYALSVRLTLDGPYADEDPIYHNDGSWTLKYAQEESQGKVAETLFTNLGLKRCMDDRVPIAVLKQLSKKPDSTRYLVLGLALVEDWKDGVFALRSTVLDGAQLAPPPSTTPSSAPFSTFTPAGIEDGRVRALREITLRQGQSAFRSGLLTAYEGRCAVTGCSVAAVLEAAHITPYLGPETNHISNGLLLRSDVHMLWDTGLIWLTDELKVEVAPQLTGSEYESLRDVSAFRPTSPALRPSLAAIQEHRAWCAEKQQLV